MEAWPEEEQTRRERLRAQREAAHSAPARIRLKLAGVSVIVVALLAWLAVSWLSSTVPAAAPVPDPPELVNGEPDADSSADLPAQARGQSGDDSAGDRPASAGGEETPGPGRRSTEAGSAGPGEEVASSAVVHVGGAVAKPGVVELPAGSRVHEAIEAAGGMTRAADPAGLNLAALVQDGTLIWVPTPEEISEGTGPPGQPGDHLSGGGQTSGSEHPEDQGPAELINLNTADAQTLQQLPGIGPALSERIITHRETSGPFGSLEELAAVSGIGPVILTDVEDLVTW
ncbi:helix-hairpin-helix domain-containing protein [Nesterenkonia lutea]|uniref:Competence protein ComEA n=1 Tax=Nesterenkonia lutea TaxID=272919 RepID=A0ABR9JDX0_9MICC|nr:helix-hairpin-helix domain-containing protein [Nesterenkonia lutea]MBE1524021.1 competence protein ComEA [Nesterenkonia lutea]